MDELKRRYETLMMEYNQITQDTLSDPAKLDENVQKIIQINTQISSILDEMIGALTLAKSSSSDVLLYRDELIERLEKIQRDYNGLVKDSDKLETLRRIRAFEDDSWKRSLKNYLIAFLAIAGFVAVLLIFKKATQKTATAITMPTSAATMPLLT